ncbi:hypothetical protein ACVWZN_002946 [Lysobacter sp. HA35]
MNPARPEVSQRRARRPHLRDNCRNAESLSGASRPDRPARLRARRARVRARSSAQPGCLRHDEYRLPQAPSRHAAALVRRPRGGRRDQARRLGDAAVHVARACREHRAPRRSVDAVGVSRAVHRTASRPRLPVVPGARGLPRHPRPDRAGRPRWFARCDRRTRWRPGADQSGGADAADRRPLARRRMRRFRSRCVHQEPCDRGAPQRGSFPLHRVDEARVQERRRDPTGQRDHASDQSGEDVAGDLRQGRRRVSRIRASVPIHTRRMSMRWA